MRNYRIHFLFLALLCSVQSIVLATVLHPVESNPVRANGRSASMEMIRSAVLSDLYLSVSEADRSALEQVGEGLSLLAEMDEAHGEFRERWSSTAEELAGILTGLHPSLHLDFTTSPAGSLDSSEPLKLPAIQGSFLMIVRQGDGPTDFRVAEINVGTSGDGQRPLALEAKHDGTMITLVRLTEIPAGPSILLWQFHSPGKPGQESWARITRAVWATTHLYSEQGGNLSLQILDETGRDTPALVRITDRETGRYLEPPHAIDLAPIMTEITKLPIYGPGLAYTHYIPGDFRGPFWVVPGGFESQIPPGEWMVEVYKGYEHVPVRTTITISSGEWTRERVTLERWVNMPDRGWHSGDDHVHSRLVSSEDARRIMTWAMATNVQVVNVLQMGDQSRSWYEQRGFGPEFRVRRGNHVLVPGQEDPRAQFGHFIALNTRSMVRDTGRYLLNDWMADDVHAQGGLYGMTHVGEGYLGIQYEMALGMPTGRVDFASIMQNTLGTDLYHDVLDLGYRLTASAGSDTPYGGSIGITRSYAYLGKGQPFDVDAWFEAFRAGRTFVTNGPMLELVVNEELLPGDEVVLDGDETLSVRVEVLGRPHGSSPRQVVLLYNGRPVHEEWNNDPGEEQIAFTIDLNAGHGGWLAVRAAGFDGSQAHTTPIRIVRKGFRPWSHERVPGLLDLMNERLDEIEAMITEQTGRMERGEMSPTDYWNRYLVLQAEGVRERVQRARVHYEELRVVWQEEAGARHQAAKAP